MKPSVVDFSNLDSALRSRKPSCLAGGLGPWALELIWKVGGTGLQADSVWGDIFRRSVKALA